MATLYRNFANSTWDSVSAPAWSTSNDYTRSSAKLAYWSAGSSDDNNRVNLAYQITYDTSAKKMYLKFKLYSRNKTITSERNGQLCSSSNYTGSFGITIKQGSTSVFTYTPAYFSNAATSTTTIASLPQLSQSTSYKYSTSSSDGTSCVMPWSADVTSHGGKALTANVRVAWGRIYTVSGTKYFEDMNMTSLGDTTMLTLPESTYTVAYNQNGHGSKPSSQTKYPGVSLTLRGAITDTSPTSVTITGNANGGTWSGSNGSATYVYVQTKWNTNSSGTGTNYSLSGSYTANSGTTLYAVWGSKEGQSYTLPTGTPTKASTTSDTYTVTFNANGGSTTKSSQTSSKTTTYSFKGWYTASSGGTQRTTSSRVTAAETVYAQFNSSTSAQSAVTLPTAAQCTRAGYQLLGFSTSDSATTATYSPGASYTPSASIILYAVWKAYKVTIKFNVNGGSITTGSGTTQYRADANGMVQRSTDSGSTWADLASYISTGEDYADLWNVETFGATLASYGVYPGEEYRDGPTSGTVFNQQTTSASSTNPVTIQRLTGSATLTADATVVLYIYWRVSQTVFPQVYINGQWKSADPYVYVSGAWKNAKTNLRVNNAWKD